MQLSDKSDSGFTTVIERDVEITRNHQGGVTGEGRPQATVNGKMDSVPPEAAHNS